MTGKKKREIVVPPPYIPKREEELINNTTTAEKVRVFEISTRISRYVSGIIIAVGALLAFVSTQFLFAELKTPFGAMSFLDIKTLFAPELRTIPVVALGFIGLVNVLCGLLLLAKE